MSRSTRPLLLVVDLGTSAAKAALVDVNGDICTTAHASYATTTGSDGTATQDPSQWLAATQNCVAACFAAAGENARDRVVGIGLTGQMQDLVLVEASTPPDLLAPTALGEAILYCDMRAGEAAERIHRQLPAWDALTGNIQDATSVAAAWARLVDTKDPRLANTRRLVFGPAGFIAWALGLGPWCDQTTAVTTGLARHNGTSWLRDVCDAAGLPPRLLPGIVGEGGGLLGRVVGDSAKLFGLPDGISCVLCPGDAATTTIGVVGTAHNLPYIYIGTSGWVGQLAPYQASRPTKTSHHLPVAAGVGDANVFRHTDALTVAALASAGATTAWGRETFLAGADTGAAEKALTTWVNTHGRTATGLVALPNLNGERFPIRSHSLPGAIIGTRPNTDNVTMYRGLLEGIACGLRHAKDEIAPDYNGPIPIAGGGAASPMWRQIIADVLNNPVTYIPESDATITGAAIITATTLGLNHRIVAHLENKTVICCEPDPQASQSYIPVIDKHRRLYHTIEELFS